MVWFFSRESELATCEIRQPKTGGYELVVTRSNRELEIESQVQSFANASELIARSLDTQDGLRREGWQPEPMKIFSETFAPQRFPTA